MANNLVYLKEEAYVEPLVNQWFVWPYLIPPVQAARYIANTHKRIMTSFVEHPQVHVMASNEPALTGGEFLNANTSQVNDIKVLLKQLDYTYPEVQRLSDAVKELDDLIGRHTNGESINYMYKMIPEPLRGFVEITLDINHKPCYRLLEYLLYRSKHYKKSFQSLYFGLLSKVNERPFCFSTPRLVDENHLQIKLDFLSIEIDVILSSRTNGVAVDVIDEIFGRFKTCGGLDYRELFTSEPPSKRHKAVCDDKVKLTFLGHASFMIETKDVSILIDPVIPVRGESYADNVISYSELPDKIDYICVTHNHHDHFNIETLLQLRHKTGKIILPMNNGGALVDPSMKLIAKQLGFEVIEVDDFYEIGIPNGKITSIPFIGEHGDLNIRSKTVWLIEMMGKKFFFGADATNYEPEMYRHVQEIIGDVDVLAIGMECVGAPYTWIYGALSTNVISNKIKNSRRLNGADADQAYQMAATFKAKQVYLYAMGMEPWYKYFIGINYGNDSTQIIESEKMINTCESNGIPCKRLFGKHVTFH